MNIGDKVHYIPYEGCDENTYENGIVKQNMPSLVKLGLLRVVYHCGDDWDHYYNYTSELTSIDSLKEGWIELEVINNY